MARGEVDHGHAVDEQPQGRGQQDVVEVTQVGAQVHASVAVRGAGGLPLHVEQGVVDHAGGRRGAARRRGRPARS